MVQCVWEGGTGSYLLPLDLPLTQSDSLEIYPLQGLGMREDLSPFLPLCSHHHP